MSTESENLYTKNNQLIAQIYDNLSGENKSEEAISLLLNPNHISPTEQVKRMKDFILCSSKQY